MQSKCIAYSVALLRNVRSCRSAPLECVVQVGAAVQQAVEALEVRMPWEQGPMLASHRPLDTRVAWQTVAQG
jgi:hypothetical protein